MAESSLFYYSSEVASASLRELALVWRVTGAAPALPAKVPANNASLIFPTGAHPTQVEINAFLGTTDEFLDTQFDAAAIPPAWIGGIVNMDGQAAEVAGAVAYYSPAVGTEEFAVMTAETLEISSAAAASVQLGADGNLAFKVSLPNISTGTSGTLIVKVLWQPK